MLTFEQYAERTGLGSLLRRGFRTHLQLRHETATHRTFADWAARYQRFATYGARR